MTKTPIDYSKGLIYKLVCKDDDITYNYIGSTTNFKQRKNTHKSCCNNENNKEYPHYKYFYIRDNGGWDNWDMVLVKYFECKTSLELRAEERKQITLLGGELNKHIPTRTQQERRKENLKEIRKRDRNHYHKNKVKILEKHTCGCGGSFTINTKKRHDRCNKHIKYINTLTN